MRALLDSGEKTIIEISVLGPCGGSAQYVVGKSGFTKISGSLPTPEQFEAAYQTSQRERFSPKDVIGRGECLPRSETTAQPQCKFEQPAEPDRPPIVDPLAAVHRRRR
jgi:hypothetical protein